MSNVVALPARSCAACRSQRHLRCGDWFAYLADEDPRCACGCWDSKRCEIRAWGHTRHAEADAFGYSRIMQTRLAIERSNSYDLHVPRERGHYAVWATTRGHYEARRD